MAQHPVSPAPQRPDAKAGRKPEPELIPKPLLRAMIGIALLSLALTTYSVLTKRPHEGVPAPGNVVAEKMVILKDIDARHATVADAEGKILLDLPEGGFVDVMAAAVRRSRAVARITDNPPVRIVRYDNGRLTMEDPATGWSAELYAFGADSKAAFERILDMK
ncbi:putative photosynthetic complex assembly protein [Rhodobacter viridis]|uniref:Putative photosynthetic complex assembly protein n=1 Tax=Rhodobacter viridis TaxID=1054202 RepID=A0A318U4B7_9RHOB|nr:photosynthetic complex assembly protein PuhC [Rhodobacter viridis]PYF10556.1 putative photosynthetic complex assembly protein [Rhodobacter viridis]